MAGYGGDMAAYGGGMDAYMGGTWLHLWGDMAAICGGTWLHLGTHLKKVSVFGIGDYLKKSIGTCTQS